MTNTPSVSEAPIPGALPSHGVPYKKLTVHEVAEWWDCSSATIFRLVRSDPEFPAPFVVGKAIIRFDRDELAAYLEKTRSKQPLEVRATRTEKKPGQARAKGR